MNFVMLLFTTEFQKVKFEGNKRTVKNSVNVQYCFANDSEHHFVAGGNKVSENIVDGNRLHF